MLYSVAILAASAVMRTCHSNG